ncbi:hypothetical protein [Vallitalea sp.]|jgi:hypothetical protein|uniref:hypothetical protein n=1 Tax=Vallitalea sp. TaxID=1882829 RepID=UPI0025DCDFE1|nr:hypothetical protein [Vallitalea sp.]MCT4686273.1 hypothetical protein [Vallitalea sp.]
MKKWKKLLVSLICLCLVLTSIYLIEYSFTSEVSILEKQLKKEIDLEDLRIETSIDINNQFVLYLVSSKMINNNNDVRCLTVLFKKGLCGRIKILEIDRSYSQGLFVINRIKGRLFIAGNNRNSLKTIQISSFDGKDKRIIDINDNDFFIKYIGSDTFEIGEIRGFDNNNKDITDIIKQKPMYKTAKYMYDINGIYMLILFIYIIIVFFIIKPYAIFRKYNR